MKQRYHKQRCLEFFGENFKDVNEWLDYEFRNYGPKHRHLRHNPEGVEQCVLMFGERARCAALLHLYDDHEYFQYYTKEGKKIPTMKDRLMAEIYAEERREDFEDGV